MSTGFECMKSSYTNFWHPAVDATDRFDPTFQGVPRKAKVDPKLTAQHQERGKRIQAAMQAHDPKVMCQLPEQHRDLQAVSDVQQNRFGNGFTRRMESTIQQDRLRVMKTADERARKDAAADARRVRGAGRNFSQFDTISGQPTEITKYFPSATPVSSDRPELLHKAMHWPERQQSTVFGSSAGSSMRSSTGQSLSRRQQQLLNEGLTSTKREWSVAQQMSCNDGYVVR